MVKLTSTRNDHHRKAIDSLNGIYNAFINLPIPVKVQIFREFKKTNQTIVSDIVGIREYTNKKEKGYPATPEPTPTQNTAHPTTATHETTTIDNLTTKATQPNNPSRITDRREADQESKNTRPC